MAQDSRIGPVIDVIDTEGYPNSFYGTYTQYQRIGWFFDKIVNNLEELTNPDTKKVLTGRFVLVLNEDMIFQRVGDNYEIENDSPLSSMRQYEQISEKAYRPGSQTLANKLEGVTGFKFIGFASRRAIFILNEHGYIDADLIDRYKIADTDIIRTIGAFYFPTKYNEDFQKEE